MSAAAQIYAVLCMSVVPHSNAEAKFCTAHPVETCQAAVEQLQRQSYTAFCRYETSKIFQTRKTSGEKPLDNNAAP